MLVNFEGELCVTSFFRFSLSITSFEKPFSVAPMSKLDSFPLYFCSHIHYQPNFSYHIGLVSLFDSPSDIELESMDWFCCMLRTLDNIIPATFFESMINLTCI